MMPQGLDGWPAVLRWLLRPRVFWAVFAGMAVLRVWTIGRLALVPDEAYYWIWSRHLSMSYFDHPPMAAWLIRLSTALLGNAECAVRLPGAAMSLGSIPLVMWGARALSEDPMIARLAGLILLLSPITAVVGSVATPDAPVWFFGCAAIAAACRAVRSERAGAAHWPLFGILLGLALLSKYTAVLIGPAVFFALLLGRDGRSHLARPWFWLGALMSVVAFLPVLIWNARHEWASFTFQLGHGFRSTRIAPWKGVGDLLGGMFLAWTPILFVLTTLGTVQMVWTYRRQPLAIRALLWWLGVPLCLFLFSATRRRAEINWPLLMGVPAALVTAIYIVEASRLLRRCAAIGVCIAALMAVGVQVPPLLLSVAPRVPHFNQLFGYDELAREVSRLAEGRPVFSNRYQDAAELAYYGPRHPVVWPLNRQSRPNAYDYFAAKPDLGGVRSAVFVNIDPQVLPEFTIVARSEWPTVVGGRTVRVDVIMIGERAVAE